MIDICRAIKVRGEVIAGRKEQIMSSKAEKFKKSFHEDRRKTDRLSRPAKVFYSLSPGNQWTGPVSLHDIGGNGAQFECGKGIEKGEIINLRIELSGEAVSVLLKGEVRWLKEEDDRCVIGVKFGRMRGADRRKFMDYFGNEIMLEHMNSEGELS